jgi:hypothetical protein
MDLVSLDEHVALLKNALVGFIEDDLCNNHDAWLAGEWQQSVTEYSNTFKRIMTNCCSAFWGGGRSRFIEGKSRKLHLSTLFF